MISSRAQEIEKIGGGGKEKRNSREHQKLMSKKIKRVTEFIMGVALEARVQ